MIYTMTPNPALDIGGEVENILPNEKNYVSKETRAPGGNGVNVARILHRLRAPVKASGFLGGATGEEYLGLLKKEKVPCDFVQIKNETRFNLTMSVIGRHWQTRFSFPGPQIIGKEKQKLFKKLENLKSGDTLMIGGSLPPGFSETDILSWIPRLQKEGIAVWVDIPGASLKKVVKAGPDFIKPNLTEFQELVGKKLKLREDILNEISKLHKYIPLICVSSVGKGAILSTAEAQFYGEPPKIKLRSTVGAGDSMVGAMLYHLSKKADVGETLRWGLAAACATLEQPGTQLAPPERIHHYLPKIKIREL